MGLLNFDSPVSSGWPVLNYLATAGTVLNLVNMAGSLWRAGHSASNKAVRVVDVTQDDLEPDAQSVIKNTASVASKVLTEQSPKVLPGSSTALVPAGYFNRAVTVLPSPRTVLQCVAIVVSDTGTVVRKAATVVAQTAYSALNNTGLVLRDAGVAAGRGAAGLLQLGGSTTTNAPLLLGAPATTTASAAGATAGAAGATAGAAGATAGAAGATAGAAGAAAGAAEGAAGAGAAGSTFSSMFSGASSYLGSTWTALSWGTTIAGGLGALGVGYMVYKYLRQNSGVNVTQTNNNQQTVNLKFDLAPGTELVQKTEPDGSVSVSVKQQKVQQEKMQQEKVLHAKQDARLAEIVKKVLAEQRAQKLNEAASAA